MPTAECPSCIENVRLPESPRLGQKVTCPHCGEKLEVVYLDPIELDYEEDDEDYEEYDDD